jgi:dihydrofolate synthase/folylpolyglutamate synthase
MTFPQCLEYLYNKLPVYQRIGAAAYKADLENIVKLLSHFGNPHLHFKSIHVGGTNGKGSISHNLASIFQEAGYKTGLYTSPHLKDFRERIRINGEMIPKKYVIDFTKNNQSLFEAIKPSFFEMTVAMAFQYFAQQKIDIAIVEVGMGGRLDSTNVIQPLLSVISNISYDHQQFLGNTLEDIAGEKGGIIKENTPVVIGETQAETTAIFTEIAQQKHAPIFFADKHIGIEHQIFPKFDVLLDNKLIYRNLTSPLRGIYQEKNIKTVLAACTVLGEAMIPKSAVKRGLKNCVTNTHLMGRWQTLQENPLCIADTGHNEAGIGFVCRQLAQTPHNQLHFVLSMVNDKDIEKILVLLPKDAVYYFCMVFIPRGLDADLLQKSAQRFDLQGKVYLSVRRAYLSAKRAAKKDDLVFVGGSNFTVAEVV